jgi:hypothetical protein
VGEGVLDDVEVGSLLRVWEGAMVSMMNNIRRAQCREVPASDGSTGAMLFIVADDVREVVEGKQSTARRVASSADAVSPPPLSNTIMHHTFRSSSLALYQLHTTESAPLMQTWL